MSSAINILYDKFNNHADFDKYINWIDHEKPDFIECHRNIWFNFYENFMFYWKISRVHIEDLSHVDWPSTQQIKLFLRIVEPLDYFYFTLKLGLKWENNCEVYSFLREFLASKGHEVAPVEFKFTRKIPSPPIKIVEQIVNSFRRNNTFTLDAEVSVVYSIIADLVSKGAVSNSDLESAKNGSYSTWARREIVDEIFSRVNWKDFDISFYNKEIP